MTRPLRIEFSGALYHVTSRGDRREDIYLDDDDRLNWLEVLGIVCKRFNWVVHAYCLMSNHYHLVVETPDGNLSAGMRHLNGLYTQTFNRQRGVVGHLFQGRFKAVLVQKEAHLLELARYVVLNPVRARMVKSPEDWPWSSYCSLLEARSAPAWLDTDWLLAQFGTKRSLARKAYQEFVWAGRKLPSPLLAARHQLFLGDDDFIAKHLPQSADDKLSEISQAHRRAMARPLADYAAQYPDRNTAMAKAHASGAYSMAEIAAFFGVHYMTVSRAVRAADKNT
jgi:putative transposase